MDQDRGVAVDPGRDLTDGVSPESPHLLTEGEVLAHVLRAAVVLPAAVLEVPHSPHSSAWRVGQLQCQVRLYRYMGGHTYVMSLVNISSPINNTIIYILWPHLHVNVLFGNYFYS